MAASSPAATKSTSDTTTTTATTATATAAAAAAAAATPSPPLPFQRMDTPPKTQRGLNKPKCIQCGNVARSRCPYRSCKSCCSKAQNPCHIHVLKSNSAYPEKTPTSSTPSSDQKATQASSQATPLRVPSFRQLSNAFAQFDNLQVRSKKHLTIKDAVALNEWRFSKLKEFKDRNIEVENEAFELYMQNISLLEEVFSTKSIHEGSNEDEVSKPNPSSQEDETWMMTSDLKLTLRSDPVRTDNSRKRIQQIVDQGIKKLQKCEADDGANDPDDQNKHGSRLNKLKTLWVERASVLSDFVDKLNKARSEEDLKSCLEMKARLYNQSIEQADRKVAETKDAEALTKQGAENDVTPRKVADYLLPKLFTPIVIDQETINKVDVHFSSLEQIEDL
ncbi:uncharacterized protein LOC110426219 [Herrania umbratica]|uniref:Uncharacterized protein LOC110426219 n=1 Tax=Herrania umbratica TaxID=108875 RepID=A0A6J1BC50_9ROSI|nr:uncharacterized protein LOC110426219 [Herrania umbratica]